jgi:aminoglycoside phosphotransferase (APT) family kinase protein
MPYKSKAQQAYFNANRAKLEAQGVDVDEWNAASRGKKLPARVKPKKPASEAADEDADLAAYLKRTYGS